MNTPRNKYIAVILALERSGELNSLEHRPYLAQIPVAGRPMLEWVLRSVHNSDAISGVVVLGPNQINELYCHRMIDIQKFNYQIDIEELIKLLPEKKLTRGQTFDLSPHSHFIFLNTSSILISSAHLEKIIDDFEQINQPVAVIATKAERIVHEHYLPSFTFKLDREAFAPAAIVLIKDALQFSNAINRLNCVLDYKFRTTNMPKTEAPPSQWFDSNEKDQCSMLYSGDFETSVLVTTHQEQSLAVKKLSKQRPFSRKKNCVLIVNPFSGSGSAISKQMRALLGLKQRSFEQGVTPKQLSLLIKNYLSEYGLIPEVHITKSSGDATEYAKFCVKNHRDMVIVAGGDGTINAVINGLATTEVVCGIIPLGTVNLLATELDIPSDIRSACQLLVDGTIRTIDLGRINGRYFASLAGVGFDACVRKKTGPQLKRLLGAVAFIFSAIKNLTSYPFRSIRILIDNESRERKGYLLVIGNGKFFGANMPVAPQARIDDKKLDLVLYKRHDIKGIITYFWQIKAGNIVQNPYTDYLQVERVSILAHGHHLIHGDGEMFGTAPATIQVVPSALRIIC